MRARLRAEARAGAHAGAQVDADVEPGDRARCVRPRRVDGDPVQDEVVEGASQDVGRRRELEEAGPRPSRLDLRTVQSPENPAFPS